MWFSFEGKKEGGGGGDQEGCMVGGEVATCGQRKAELVRKRVYPENVEK